MTDPLSPLKRLIRDIPDFPKQGILFRDITPLLADPSGLALAVELMANPFRGKNIDLVVGAESRGFIFGTAVACCLSAGFILVRKPGRLPREVSSVEYQLEYGVDALEVHSDAVRDGARVLVHDDLLATGGTAGALCELVEQAGGVVAGCAFVIELAFLHGRDRLKGYDVRSLVVVDDE